MQPQETKPSLLTGMKQRRVILVVTIVLSVIVAGIVYYFVFKVDPMTASNRKEIYPYSYSSTDHHTLKSESAGGISFSKPVEYEAAFNTSGQVGFAHTFKNGNTSVPLGALHAASATGDTSEDRLKQFEEGLRDVKDPAFKSVSQSLLEFVTSRFSPLYDVSFTSSEKFSSESIQNGWRIGLEASPKEKYKDAPGMDNYRGTVVLIAQKGIFYYFFVYNTDYNWNSNMSTWQKVLNSIKVEQ